MLGSDWIALVVTLGLALAWLRINDFLAHKGFVSGPLSRKIIHIGTGPIFVLCWLFFTDSALARWLAALVPLAITAQFALVGLGVIKDQQAVDAMSRTGKRQEILRGPLFYGIVFIVLTLVYWRESAIGIVALMILCGGDGLADVIGKRIPSMPIPWSPRKTLAGSIAGFVGGSMFSLAVVAVFTAASVLPDTFIHYVPGIILVSLGCTVVESLPFNDIDNLTVPFTAVLLGHLLF